MGQDGLSSSVLTKEDLTNYLETIIIEIRNQPNAGTELKYELQELKKYQDTISKSNSVATLFTIYEQIQKTSMEVRKLLSRFVALEVYDSIGYAFYYNGKRYYANGLSEEQQAKWLTKSSSTGELKLKLYEAEKELKDDLTDELRQQVNEIFNKHYAVFLAAIKGTYNGEIGRRGALNYGHLAEAYESHTEEHHPAEYKVINNLAKATHQMTVADKMMIAYETEAGAVSYWANHEGINSAWQHIRDSLGTQRGTVAGDVKSTQVKQGKTGAGRIRLARLNTLIQGVNSYCAILDDSKSPREVAAMIADYISEPVRQMSDKIIDNIVDEEIKKMFKDMNENIKIQAHVKV